MNPPTSRRDFFALEAGEYLERLAQLVAAETLEPESLVRFARALRGAALMAGPPGYAAAAAAIEQLAKALRAGSARWSPALAEQLHDAIATCQLLLRRLREWSEQDIARCERTAHELSGLVAGPGGRPSSPVTPAATAPTQSAAVRAFIARETAALAAVVESAAAALEAGDPALAATLTAAGQRLQPLRGLGAMPDLAPLPELLEAFELTLAHSGQRGAALPPGAGAAFRATSRALARLARDIAELGLPKTDAPELVEASERLRQAFADEGDVVPITSLFADSDSAPVVRQGIAPPAPAPAPNLTLELLGLADRLREASAQLRAGVAGPARALPLYSLVLSLRGLTLSPALSGSAGGLLARLDRVITSGSAVGTADRLAGLVERAARLLADAAESGGAARLTALLAPLSQELDRWGAPAEAPIVPIESLAPSPAPSPQPPAPEAFSEIVPIEALDYDPGTYTAFEQSFSTLYRLRHEPAVVPIGALLYRGKRALERADLVRRELDAALRGAQQLSELRQLLTELLDLVPLALDDQSAPAPRAGS